MRRLGVPGIFIIMSIGYVVAALGQVTSTPLDQPADTLPDVVQYEPVDSAELIEGVYQALNLSAGTVITLNLDKTPERPLRFTVPIESISITLDLFPHSVRSSIYEVIAQQADGSYVTVEPGPVRTLRGRVVEMEGSAAAGSMEEKGLFVMIQLGDERRYWMEPLVGRVPGAAEGHYAVYRDQDITSVGMCANDGVPMGPLGIPPAVLTASSVRVTNPVVAELACDADVQYFSRYGSVANTVARINSVINAVNLQYESEVNITHAITTIIVRTSEPDPYSSTDTSTRLCQFITQWTNNHTGVQRDLAHLFTGVDLNDNTIGQAADIGNTGICHNSGSCTGGAFGTQGSYCIAQSDFSSIFSCATDLSAHEMGHLWGAFHCTCPTTTMHTPIMCANTFIGSGSSSVSQIVNYRNSLTCLCSSPNQTCDPVVYVNRTNAGCETGSSQNPFNTVGEGVAQVCSGGVLNIAANSYPETMSVNKAMTINATGGTVRIGP